MKRLLLFCVFTGIAMTASAKVVTGFNLSTPLLFSGSAGLILGDGNPASEPMPMIEGELGYGGGRLLVGVDSSGQGLGFGVKAALLRTWFEPINVDADQTYLGVELQGNAGMILGSLGGYYNIDGDDDSFITSLLVGIRF